MCAAYTNKPHKTNERNNHGKHGLDYELYVASLFFKRVIGNNFDDYKITREKTELGKFDDLALVYKKEGKSMFRLIQIKHIADKEKKISYSQLVTYESYFLLTKYFNHYLQCSFCEKEDSHFENAELQDLIICTNIGFDMEDFKGKCITLCQVNEPDVIFQDSFSLFKLEIPKDHRREIFWFNYLTSLEQLAYQLWHHYLLKLKLDIQNLRNNGSLSLIKTYHVALAKSVIDVENGSFRKEFVYGNTANNFREILFSTYKTFYVGNDLQRKLDIKVASNFDSVQKLLRRFDATEKSFKNILSSHKFYLGGKFGVSSHPGDRTVNLSKDENYDEEKIDKKLVYFLDKLVFAVQKCDNIQTTILNELKNGLKMEFHTRMNDWYHNVSKSNIKAKNFREWFTKTALLQEAMKKEVTFPGRNTKLLLKDLVGDNIDDPEILLNVFCSTDFSTGWELPNLEEAQINYIERNLMRKIIIDKVVFKENEEDIFVLIIQDKRIFKNCIPEGEKWCSINNITKSSRFISTNKCTTKENLSSLLGKLKILHKQTAAEKEMTLPSFHIVESKENKLIWKQSFGSLTGIRGYILEDSEHFKEEEMRKEFDHDFIIVSAEPGMGKSMLFNGVYRKISEDAKFSWVIQVDLKNMIAQLNEGNLKNKLSEAEVVSFLSKAANLDKLLLKCYMKGKNRKITLLLDGFDELWTKKQREKVIRLSKYMKENFAACSVWISTRPHLMEDLENELSTFAFSLQGISTKDKQIHFLTSFWEHKHNIQESDKKKIYSYAENLLNKFCKSVGESESSFLRTPLQSNMLAVAFENEVVSMELNVPEYINLFDLYRSFVETKYNIFLSSCYKDLSKDTELMNIPLKKLLLKELGDIALTSGILFSEKVTRKMAKNNLNFSKELHLRTGIVCKKGDQYYFTHKTYYEYFAASRLAGLTRKKSYNSGKYKNVLKFLKNYILKGKNNIILHFFDYLVANDLPFYQSILRGNVKVDEAARDLVKNPDTIGRPALYYALTYGKSETLLKLLKELNAEVDISNIFIRHSIKNYWNITVKRYVMDEFWNLTETGMDEVTEYIIKTILEKSQTEDLSANQRAEILPVGLISLALLFKKFHLVDLMIKRGAIVNKIKIKRSTVMPLVHALKMKASSEIINSIVNITDKECFDTKILLKLKSFGWFNYLLLECEYKVFCQVVEKVKEKGADLNSVDAKGSTYLHIVLEIVLGSFGKSKKFNHGMKIAAAQILLEMGVKYNLKNRNEQTPYEFIESKLKIIRTVNTMSVSRTALNFCGYEESNEELKNLAADEHDIRSEDLLQSVKQFQILLSIVHDLFQAVQSNSTKLVRGYITKARSHGWVKAITNVCNDEGKTLIIVATDQNHSEILGILNSMSI